MDLFSVPHLLILLVIVIVVFGTSKLKHIGSDLGGAIRNFKQAMRDDDEAKTPGTTAKSEETDAPAGHLADASPSRAPKRAGAAKAKKGRG